MEHINLDGLLMFSGMMGAILAISLAAIEFGMKN